MKIWQKAAICVGAQAAAGWLAAKLHPAAVVPTVAAVGAAGYLLCRKDAEADSCPEPIDTADVLQVCEETVADVLETVDTMETDCEPTVKLPYNVAEDRDFARWIQLFALHVKRHEERNLTVLYEGLKDALEPMGIFVYDEIQTDDEGNVVLPNADYFMDLRAGEEWTEVPLPVVYNRERVLMMGQIR